MKSGKPGTGTSGVELANVSKHGFWVLIDGRELYLPFDAFPWFGDASIKQLSEIERPRPGHLRWPLIDVDLTVASIEDPERYPLVSGVGGSAESGEPAR